MVVKTSGLPSSLFPMASCGTGKNAQLSFGFAEDTEKLRFGIETKVIMKYVQIQPPLTESAFLCSTT